ncbi:MAG: TlpA disulfide reductase family protein [Candidatus Pedobacter colombiensis]|uniref:TlpA disulfide reductase family protein n=1 Tax=Candidatus Pedobacter colombiensis TaxID=3121371 RepID=A0AAJ5W5F1_9SPHI|nr:TlpA disulfide reductase family protein [Pedobacter sp.]WEK18292.1 MAG: TlpA disulfide reductase family protein [Pedobacter sp.]
MKSIIITTILSISALSGFTQSKNGLTDDLLKDKEQVLARYIPMANGDYLHKLYVTPSTEVLGKLEEFKAAMKVKADAETDIAVKSLMLKDVDFYARQVLSRYVGVYGMDSVGMENLMKLLTEKKGAPDFHKLIDSAQKKAFVKRMEPEERSKLKKMIDDGANLNDEALFKRSAAYRTWLDSRITDLRNTKYKADTTLGYEGNNVVKLKVIENELSAGFVKDYLTYQTTGTIIKMVRNVSAKEDAYRNFMAKATNPVYKKEIEEVYANYKMMVGNSLSPDFNYTDVNGKQIALKSLRGKYVYIDVWATWCGPCKAEIPFLTKVEDDYHGKNIHFVSLSVDRIADKAKWISYVKDNKLQGIQLMADKDFSSDFVKKFNINSIPRFILIDPAGKIVSGDAKRPSDPELRKQLDRLLK